MPKIHVLDKHTAELIAAGEVVERPASVVKELLENTVDAGATIVTVEIQNGGITMMRITDNGCGIEYEDVPRAFLRHATSKVRTQEDLEKIGTLGFRGEALASIAAVADVEIITCTEDATAGTLYRIQGGEEVAYEEIGAAKGTVITVRDLFYNVPARMKFLKKDVSEGNAVVGVVQKLALSHPEISFRLLRDGREELHTPGNGDLHACIYAVMGRDFANNLLSVDYTYEGVHVYGFCCKPSATRANRTMQHFFINGRYVKTDTAAVAMSRAYQGFIMVGRFPAGVLHIDIHPAAVDVNVHPAKIEVRFVNEKPVFDAVYHGVRSALQNMNSIPQAAPVSPEKKRDVFAQSPVTPQYTGVQEVFKQAFPPPVTVKPEATKPVTYDVPEEPTPWRMEDKTPKMIPDIFVDEEPVTIEPPKKVKEAVAVQPAAVGVEETVVEQDAVQTVVPRIIGELFQTYILAEYGDALLVVDKHAAHERILYNRLKNTASPDAQMLLTPVAVTLESEPCNALLAALPILTEAGYIIEDFGSLTVLVRAVPVILSGCDVTAVIEELAGGLASGRRDILTNKEDWIYHSIACRAAVKAGDTSNVQEQLSLVQTVLADNKVRFCPHGRPVCFTMEKKDLEKQFGRIV